MSLLTLIVDNVVVQFAAWSQMDEVESLTKEKKYIYIYILYTMIGNMIPRESEHQFFQHNTLCMFRKM